MLVKPLCYQFKILAGNSSLEKRWCLVRRLVLGRWAVVALKHRTFDTWQFYRRAIGVAILLEEASAWTRDYWLCHRWRADVQRNVHGPLAKDGRELHARLSLALHSAKPHCGFHIHHVRMQQPAYASLQALPLATHVVDLLSWAWGAIRRCLH